MRVLVVGLGSMGKRRIRLMQAFFPDIALCGVDARPERREEAAKHFSIPCYDSISLAAAAWTPTVGFVCTSPLSHAAIITELLQLQLHVFTEINLVDDGYDRNVELAQQNGLVLFLSSTPLYRREVFYIADTVQNTVGPLVYRYHVGQYLPDWHPWENYQDFFVGDRRTNGCREIFAIELPWLQAAFGDILSVHTTRQQLTSLQIDYPDSYFVTVQHASGAVGQLAVDIVSRKAVRAFELVGEQLFLQWNGTPDSLTNYDFIASKQDIIIDLYETVTRDDRYADNIIENAYVDELAAFFDRIAGQPVRQHTFAADKGILAWIDQIEGVRRA